MTDETEVRALTGVFGTCAELTRTCIVAKQIPITPQAQPFQCPEKQGRGKAKENICCFKLCEIQKKKHNVFLRLSLFRVWRFEQHLDTAGSSVLLGTFSAEVSGYERALAQVSGRPWT